MKLGITETVAAIAILAAAVGAWQTHGLRSELSTTQAALSVSDERARVSAIANDTARAAVAACEAASASFRADVPGLVSQAVTDERASCSALVDAARARGRLDADPDDIGSIMAAIRLRQE